MKTSQIMISTCCVLSVIFSLCYAPPNWRPMGRFGKRTTEDDNVPDFGISHLQDIPIELMFSKNELSRRNSKPRLCSTSGVAGYPPCDAQVNAMQVATLGEPQDLANLFDL